MRIFTSRPFSTLLNDRWRYVLLLLIAIGSMAFILTQQPIPQDLNYHLFADRRPFFGIPYGFNVLSNIPFLAVGLYGARICLSLKKDRSNIAWGLAFISSALIGIGSAIYHMHPTNLTLVWDRLPMAIAFMSLTVAILSDHLKIHVSLFLFPAILSGVFSVLHWHQFDDLRFYAWVQFFPFFIIPAIMILFRSRFSHRFLLLSALVCYLPAKLAELADMALFSVSRGLISGHTLKHLLAAAGLYLLATMLKRRTEA